MKLRNRRILEYLLEEVEIGDVVNSQEAITILVNKKGSVRSGRSSYVYRNMAFIPNVRGMAHLLRVSGHFERVEDSQRKKTNWRRVS